MDNSDKKINADTLLLIDDTLRLYKEFISKPTSKTLNMTAQWYKRYLSGENVRDITMDHIYEYFGNL